MKTITLKLTGISPILLHSDRGANPLDPAAKAHKALTGKRNKTDEDHLEIAKSEYRLGFYEGDEIRIPSLNVKSCLVNGAKFNKLGTAFNRCVQIAETSLPIKHSGPKTKEQMWDSGPSECVDVRTVKVGTARLVRYRPRLNDWSLVVTILFDENMVEARQILQAAENAGNFVGLCDYRPEKGGPFGRFTVKVSS